MGTKFLIVPPHHLHVSGYGFINFKHNVHALAALRYLNNNPMFSHLTKAGSGKKGKQQERGTATSQKSRLIVEFAVEDISKVCGGYTYIYIHHS